MEFIATKTNPCTIAIEACGAAHHWARTFKKLGYQVKIIAPQFVKSYVRSNKNDKNDARAIAEATIRPGMKFVAAKSLEQQDILLRHRARKLILKTLMAQSNQVRGFLAEYGIVIPKGASYMKKLLTTIESYKKQLTAVSLEIFERLYEQYKNIEKQLEYYDKKILELTKENQQCQNIVTIIGIGVLTASAILASIGDIKTFKNGRELSAWLGLVPKQHSSGNKIILSGISKREDCYLRALLVHGAGAVLKYCEKKTDEKSLWLTEKKAKIGFNKTAVALANRHARMIWGILTSGEYKPNFNNNLFLCYFFE
jgi:transposase